MEKSENWMSGKIIGGTADNAGKPGTGEQYNSFGRNDQEVFLDRAEERSQLLRADKKLFGRCALCHLRSPSENPACATNTAGNGKFLQPPHSQRPG